MKRLPGPTTPSTRVRSNVYHGKSHHNKISEKQRFAIKEIEKVANVKFEGKTRYQAMVFIKFFLDDNRTIYPMGRFNDPQIKARFMQTYLLETSKE